LKSGQIDKAIAQSRMTLRYDPSDEVLSTIWYKVCAVSKIRKEKFLLLQTPGRSREKTKQKKLPEASIGCMKNRYSQMTYSQSELQGLASGPGCESSARR